MHLYKTVRLSNVKKKEREKVFDLYGWEIYEME